jgi:kumamolisin
MSDPASGYNIQVDGQQFAIGGTSAVAPLWAALIARINHKLGGSVGFINPQLYALAANSGFNDITAGDNKCSYRTHHNVGYAADAGWDACTGLGTPNGAALANLLKIGGQAKVADSRRPGAKSSKRAAATRHAKAGKAPAKRGKGSSTRRKRGPARASRKSAG